MRWAERRPRAGIINFVLSLERGYYLYQFGQFAWTHMILLVVFIPTSFFVSNIFDGLIWFLLPCALVIINDISAYLTGAPPLSPTFRCAKAVCSRPPAMSSAYGHAVDYPPQERAIR